MLTSLLDTILHMFTATAAETKTIFNENQPKPPMNVGEVMDAWMYLGILEGAIVVEQVGKNTTLDSELLVLIEVALNVCQSQSERIKKLLEQEGVPLPSMPADKPKSEPTAVPLGVKLTDEELANLIAANMGAALLASTRSMAASVRTDLEVMWGHFLFEHAKYGAKLKSTMKQRGWMKIPPEYHPPGSSP